MVAHLILCLVASLCFIVICGFRDALLAIHGEKIRGGSTDMIHELGGSSCLGKFLSVHEKGTCHAAKFEAISNGLVWLAFEQNARVVTVDIGGVAEHSQLLVLSAGVFLLLLSLFDLLAKSAKVRLDSLSLSGILSHAVVL